MATTLTSIAIIGGIGLQAVGQYQAAQAAAAEAKAQQAMAEYNAQVAEQQAKAREMRAGVEQRRQAEAAERHASALRAGIGAAGVVPGVGTPLLIEATQAAESELENLMIGYEGQIGAERWRSQAALDRMQGEIYGMRASSARSMAFVGAGTTLLTGFGQYGIARGWLK